MIYSLHINDSTLTYHIFQTDTKALTYLAHYLAHNTFLSEWRKDPSLALFCLAYMLHLAAKSLLILISVITCMLMTHRFRYHFHKLILSCPLLHIVFYLHNNHPTWQVFCIFQVSLGSSYHQFHNNLLCLKQNLTFKGKRAFSVAAPRVLNELPITLKTSETIPIFQKNSRHIYSNLHFHYKSSVVPRSDNDF